MPLEKEHHSLLLAAGASLFCSPLMVAGVNALLPELGMSLNASAAQSGMIGAIYSLGLAVFQLGCGSLGDIRGHRKVFLWGTLIFCASSAALALTYNIQLFLLIRLIQGAGAAMVSAAGMALVASAASPSNRAAYLGVTGMFVYAGIACGPPVAGLIAGYLNWRWLFSLTALLFALIFFLMKYTVVHEWRPGQDKKYDWQGCLLYGAAMAAFTLGAVLLKTSAAIGSALFTLSGIFFILFYLRERKCAFPVLNIKLLRTNRIFTLSCLAAFVNYASFFGLIFYFSFYLQAGKGMSVQEAGFILAIQAASQALTSPVAAKLCVRGREGKLSAAGAALCGLGLIAASFIRIDTPLAALISAQILLGCGVSLFSLANTAIILEAAGKANTGQASALTGAVRTAGQLGSMTLITLSLSLFLGKEAVNAQNLSAFMASMRSSLIIFGFLNIAAIGFTMARNKK